LRDGAITLCKAIAKEQEAKPDVADEPTAEKVALNGEHKNLLSYTGGAHVYRIKGPNDATH
jgi:hypothetical protein